MVDGYALLFATLLLSPGSLADRIGARRAFSPGMALFVVASAACGAAPSPTLRVAARLVQGASAAVVMPASLSLISLGVPRPAQARSGGGSLDPRWFGGLDLRTSRWRTVDHLRLASHLFHQRAGRRSSASGRASRLDRAAPTSAPRLGRTGHRRVAMGSLAFGAIEAGSAGLTSARVVVAFTVAALGVIAFVVSPGTTRASHGSAGHVWFADLPHRARYRLRLHGRLLRTAVRVQPSTCRASGG